MVHTIAEITNALKDASDFVSQIASDMPDEKFFDGTDENWSPAGYLQHLILSVKPYAKGLQLPKAKLESMFGLAENESRDYEGLVAVYKARIDNGIRAEDYGNVVPSEYRFPEDVGDNKQAYLVETWKSANESFIKALEDWSEEELDKYQMIHPAIGNITVREVCYFTIYHNQLHCKDIEGNQS